MADVCWVSSLMREAAIYEKSRGGRGKGGKGGSAITGRGVRRVVEVSFMFVDLCCLGG